MSVWHIPLSIANIYNLHVFTTVYSIDYKLLQEAQLSLGRADRDAYVQMSSVRLPGTERKQSVRGETVSRTLC